MQKMRFWKTPHQKSSLCSGDPSFIFETFSLYRQNKPIVQELSLTVSPGALIAVVGPNGGGKTTLLDFIADPVHKKTTGLCKRGLFSQKLTGYLPQKSEAQRFFPLSVTDVVAQGLWQELGFLRAMEREHFQRVQNALNQVGLQDYAHHPVRQLSGGQFQRTLFARLAAQDPLLMLLDEPFNGIDEATQKDLLALFQQWHARKKTIVAVMHDVPLIRRFFPHTLLLARDYHVFGETEKVLQLSCLQEMQRRAQIWERSW